MIAASRATVPPGFAREVRAFGVDHGRTFPWRSTTDPWAILVSEVMLQQTQAARVIGPYERFLSRFPTARRCGAASLGEVLRAWSGLGYNRRAERLHRTARLLVDCHGGRVPSEVATLSKLPGVGPYTARAVACFAFGAPLAVVDTNVARVLSRCVAGRPLRRAEAQALAEEALDRRGAFEHNQAMFDLGATVCTRRRPRCASCPLRSRCRWASSGWSEPDPASAGAARPSRQTPFEGSARQARGRLLEALRQGPLTEPEVASILGAFSAPTRRAATRSLEAEGLVVRRGGVLHLP